jgi:hypothetical protein
MPCAFQSWRKENEEATTGTLEVGLRPQCSSLKKLGSGFLPDPMAVPRTRWCLSFPPCAVGVFPHLHRHRSPSMHTHLLPETTDYRVDSDLCARGEAGRPPHLPCLRHPADDVILLCLFSTGISVWGISSKTRKAQQQRKAGSFSLLYRKR